MVTPMLHTTPAGPPSHLDSRSIIRATIYIQTAFRRFLVEDCRKILGIRPTVPMPAVAVALSFCKRLLHPEQFDMETEAMVVTAIICGREKGLTLRPIATTHEEYLHILPQDHPVLLLLRERFKEVAVDAEEDLLARLKNVELPSEARLQMGEWRTAWGVPPEAPDREEHFKVAETILQGLRLNMEVKLTAQLERCQTQAAFDSLSAELERELGDSPTVLTGRVRAARQNHHEHVKLAAQTAWGWPPTGSPASLARAARWYAVELGVEHPVVEDFIAAARRQCRQEEAAAIAELKPMEASLTQLRRQLAADPAPPKLIADGFQEELQQINSSAFGVLKHWQQELRYESQAFLQYAHVILGRDAFIARCEVDAEKAATELRQAQNGQFHGMEGGAAEAESHMEAAVCLYQICTLFQAESATLANLAIEFSPHLEHVQHLVVLLQSGSSDGPGDGWHRPPNFEYIEQPLAPRELPPPSPVQVLTPQAAPEFKPDISVRMRLHGVSIIDARNKSEVLLLEQCARIIAQECSIPREWISQITFVDPTAGSCIVDARHDSTCVPNSGLAV